MSTGHRSPAPVRPPDRTARPAAAPGPDAEATASAAPVHSAPTGSTAPVSAAPAAGATGPADLAGHAWRGLRTLLLERHDRRKEAAEALGMSFNRVKALRRIAEAPLTLRALADFMVVDAPYTTVIVDDLVRRGLADRTTDPADRRRKVVRPTAAGREAAAEAARVLDTPPPALAALPPEDLAALDRVVGHLLAHQETAADGCGAQGS